ncbi:MAG: NADH-quinone oxidoreductase subunit N [Chloroflexi bacterium]|nr:NADH-quinone oxidoreductase subunit N [Chloroflexota bacterium]
MSLDVIPEIILAAGGIVILLYALFAPRRAQPGAAILALVTVAAAAAVSAAMLRGTEQLTFTGTYARDGAAVWSKLIVLAGTAVVIGLSVPWFRGDPRHGEYYTLLLFSALGAILLAGATDLKEFLMAMMLSSATGFILVAYHRRSSPAAEAAIKYYLLGALTSAGALIGVAYLFGLAGSTTLTGLSAGLPSSGTNLALIAGAALVVLALTYKTAAVPAHAWMPDVAQGAPAPVAAFVTSIPKVGGFLFLARFVLALPDGGIEWRPLIAILAAATMTLGNLAALWQDDVRRLLGWSAVSQTGYGLMAIVALERSDLAVPSLLFFLLAYVLGNAAAFGVVSELRGRSELAAYSGLARTRPWLAGALSIALLSFLGVPPLAGFFAKLVLFAAAIEAGYTWLTVLAAVNTIVSIAYYARVLAPAYFGDLASPVPVLGRWAAAATLASAAAVIVIGIGSEPFLRAFADVSLLPG